MAHEIQSLARALWTSLARALWTSEVTILILLHIHEQYRQLRARRGLSISKDVPLITSRAPLLYNDYADSALLGLNGTSLNSDNALLAPTHPLLIWLAVLKVKFWIFRWFTWYKWKTISLLHTKKNISVYHEAKTIYKPCQKDIVSRRIQRHGSGLQVKTKGSTF